MSRAAPVMQAAIGGKQNSPGSSGVRVCRGERRRPVLCTVTVIVGGVRGGSISA